MRESLLRKLTGALRIQEVEAGLHTVWWLQHRFIATTVARAAAVKKVEVIPVSAFALKAKVAEGLLLGFGAVDHWEIRRGVDVLAAAIDKSAAGWWLRLPG
jgi:DNA-binding transcriptional MocR family regulator